MADQKITGVPGSPSATTTIDGKQLPPQPPKFGGVIKESARDSTPWWAPRVVPPKDAPNVLLIMTDDQGYGVSMPFKFTGTIDKLTFKLGPSQLSEVEQKIAAHDMAMAHD